MSAYEQEGTFRNAIVLTMKADNFVEADQGDTIPKFRKFKFRGHLAYFYPRPGQQCAATVKMLLHTLV
jgi:hypothetical protein